MEEEKTYYHNKVAGAEVHFSPDYESPRQIIYIMAKSYMSGVIASTPLEPDDAMRYGQAIIEAARAAKLFTAMLDQGF